MSNVGVRPSRLAAAALAAPVVVGAVLAGLTAVHSGTRWAAVNRTCPTLDVGVASMLGMGPTPLPDGDERGAHDGVDRRTCHYIPGDDTDNALRVTVSLHRGGILRSSHGAAVAALGEDPPAGFQPVGAQDGGDRRFGHPDAGPSWLLLSSVVDNALVRVQLYHQDRAAGEAPALRTPMQAVADQAVANLG